MVSHRIVAYLIGLAVGYWVLTLADKEKDFTKTVGKVIGWVIIVVSFFGPLCLAGSALICHSHSGSCNYSAQCPWNGGGHECQMGSSGMLNGQCPEMGQGMMEGREKKNEKGMMKGKGMMDGKDMMGDKEKSQ